MSASVADLLRRSAVFGRLTEPELRRIARLFKERRIHHGQQLFRQGDAADSLYVVVSGRLRISAADEAGHQKVLAFAAAGEMVGEMGVLSGEPRSATAVATDDTDLLQLRKADFDALLADDVDLMRDVGRVVAARRETTQRRVVDESSRGDGYRQGLVTTVWSPRGGAGTTTIATNLAVALAQRVPDRVVLVDLNLLFGHVPVLLNLTPRTSLAALSVVSLRQMDRENLEFYLSTHAESSLRVLSSVLRPEEGELVTAEHAQAAFDVLRRYFEHVICDMGRGFSDVNLTALEAAHNVVTVCTADREGIRGVAEQQRVVRELLGLPDAPLHYVLNHPSPYAAVSPQQLEHRLNLQLLASLPFGGDAPGRAALEGRPLVSRFPNSATSRAILGLAARVERQLAEVRALEPAIVAADEPPRSREEALARPPLSGRG
jgi:Flp pilus assembly CpaE family ATPase